MKRYEVRMTLVARRDITDIARWIASEHPGQARRWLADIGEAMTDLETLPRRPARAEQSDHLGYEVRRRVVGDYLIFFTIAESSNRVDVLRVWPARRRPLEPGELQGVPPEFDDESTLVDDE